MSELKPVRTSLEVGFAEGELPERFVRYRGRARRAIGALKEFPFEDAQFEVVMLAGKLVSHAMVREAHRVLRPDGRLFFVVPEKTKKQAGLTLPEIYSIVREGYNLIVVERPSWWRFGRDGHTLTICAQKKNWKRVIASYRPYV